jgi:hypothetical protein
MAAREITNFIDGNDKARTWRTVQLIADPLESITAGGAFSGFCPPAVPR